MSESETASADGSALLLPPVPTQSPEMVELESQMDLMKEQVRQCTTFCRNAGEGLLTMQQALHELKGRTVFLEVRIGSLSKHGLDKAEAPHQGVFPPERRGEFVESPRKTDALNTLDVPSATEFRQNMAAVRAMQSKLMTLCQEWKRSHCGADLELRSLSHLFSPTDQNEEALMPSDSASTLRGHAALEADVDMLRAKLHEIVNVDLHAIASNVRELQTELMDTVEINRVDLQDQVERVEAMCKERLTELRDMLAGAPRAGSHGSQGRAGSKHTDAMINQIKGKVQDLIKNLNTKPLTHMTSEQLQSIPYSELVALTNSEDGMPEPQRNGDSFSTDAGTQHSLTAQIEQALEPSRVIEDLRDTILSYFRSEFQAHVTHVLERMQLQKSFPNHRGELRTNFQSTSSPNIERQPQQLVQDDAEEHLRMHRSVSVPASAQAENKRPAASHGFVASPGGSMRLARHVTPGGSMRISPASVNALGLVREDSPHLPTAGELKSLSASRLSSPGASLSASARVPQLYASPSPRSRIQRQASCPVSSSPRSPAACPIASSPRSPVTPSQLTRTTSPRGSIINISTAQYNVSTEAVATAQLVPQAIPVVWRQASYPATPRAMFK